MGDTYHIIFIISLLHFEVTTLEAAANLSKNTNTPIGKFLRFVKSQLIFWGNTDLSQNSPVAFLKSTPPKHPSNPPI